MSVINSLISQNPSIPVDNTTPTSDLGLEALPSELQQAIVRFLPFGERGELAQASRKMQAQVMTVSSNEEPRQISTFITNEIIPRLNGVIKDMALTPDERGENLQRLTQDIDKKVSDLCAQTDTIDESVREALEENVKILKDINPDLTEETAGECVRSIKALVTVVQDLPLNKPDKQSLLNDLFKVRRAIFVCWSQANRIQGCSKSVITKIIGLLELLANHNHAVHSNGDFEELKSYIMGIKGLVRLAFSCAHEMLINYILSDCKLMRAPYRDTFRKSFKVIAKKEPSDITILHNDIEILKMDRTELKKYLPSLVKLMRDTGWEHTGKGFVRAAVALGDFNLAWDILQERYSNQGGVSASNKARELAVLCAEVLRSSELSRQHFMSESFMAFFSPLLSHIYESAPSDDATLYVYAIVLRLVFDHFPRQAGDFLASIPEEIKQALSRQDYDKCLELMARGNIQKAYYFFEALDVELGSCQRMFHFCILLQNLLLKDVAAVALDDYVERCDIFAQWSPDDILGVLQHIDLHKCSSKERHVYVTIWTKMILMVSFRSAYHHNEWLGDFIRQVPKTVFEQMDGKCFMMTLKGLKNAGLRDVAREIADLYATGSDRLIMELALRPPAFGFIMKRELMLPPNYSSALPQDTAAEAEERRYHPSELEPTDGNPKRRRRDDTI